MERVIQDRVAPDNLHFLSNLATIAMVAEDKRTAEEEQRNLKKYGSIQRWSNRKVAVGN